MFCEVNGDLYKNGVVKPLTSLVGAVTTLKIQSSIPSGTITFTVQGKLRSDFDYVDLTGIKDNGLSTATSISDSSVYSFDVTGYYAITVNVTTANANAIIYGTIFGER